MNLANQNAPATPKQLWALFCGTGLNTKGLTITVGKASNLISDMKNGIDITQELIFLGATGTPKVAKKTIDFQELYNKAHEAGMQAVRGLVPVPMTVINNSTREEYFVPDGPCGFAWIVIKPGTSSFAKWLIAQKLASKHYAGGVCVWVSQFNQSVQRKEKYAFAFAKILQEAGIKAFADSRLD